MEVLQWIMDNSYMILYSVTVLVAIYRYPRYFDTPLKYFPILLTYTFLNELLGLLIYDYEDVRLILGPIFYNNWIIYNIYNLIFYLYFYMIFRSYIENKQHKKWILRGVFILLITSLINVFLQDFTYEPQTYAYIVGGVILIICVILHALQLYRSNGRWFSQYNLLSWVGLGLIVFYSGYLPIKIMRQYYAYEGFIEHSSIRNIHVFLILFMNVCFILGFLKMRRKSLE